MGSTNRQADDALINEMQRFARGEAFDERPMPGLDSEAVDFRAASESFATVRRVPCCCSASPSPTCRDAGLAAPVLDEIGSGPQDPKRRYVSPKAP